MDIRKIVGKYAGGGGDRVPLLLIYSSTYPMVFELPGEYSMRGDRSQKSFSRVGRYIFRLGRHIFRLGRYICRIGDLIPRVIRSLRVGGCLEPSDR